MSGKSRKAGNLVALGSAAVVAVYGAGFMRTADAAQRFARQSDERVLSPEDAAEASAQSGETGGTTGASDSELGASTPRVVTAVIASAANPGYKSDATVARAESLPGEKLTASNPVEKSREMATQTLAKPTVVNAPTSSQAISVPVPPEVTTVLSASGVPVASGAAQVGTNAAPAVTVLPVAEKTVVVAPVKMVATPVVTVQPAPVTAPVPAVSAEPVAAASGASLKWKDGEYTGYGTSRHGDVEVYLETTDGKITYIKISQCLTQYSCSWIAELPRQVLARQSTKVDAVSGATQSANAFYYAVVQALAKAK